MTLKSNYITVSHATNVQPQLKAVESHQRYVLRTIYKLNLFSFFILTPENDFPWKSGCQVMTCSLRIDICYFLASQPMIINQTLYKSQVPTVHDTFYAIKIYFNFGYSFFVHFLCKQNYY